jgi:hypothetical protein
MQQALPPQSPGPAHAAGIAGASQLAAQANVGVPVV